MAGNDNKADKRQLRAERRAAEEAAARAQAEREAKERKQQTIIGAIVAGIVVVLIAIGAFAVYNTIRSRQVAEQQQQEQSSPEARAEAKKALNAVATKPSHADDEGAIVISKNGYGVKVEDAPTVAFYMEPLCPGCATVHRSLDETLEALIDAGQINLELHFMVFQDNKSTITDANGEETTDHYSTRAFNGAMVIAEQDPDPDHLMGYLKNIYAEDFQPGELTDYEPVSNEQLKQQALDAGVSQEVADMAFDGETPYVEWLEAADNYTIRRTELYNENGGFSSPTLAINGTYWATSTPSKAGLDFADGFLAALGLSADQVGQSGAMPSIGADGEPIALS